MAYDPVVLRRASQRLEQSRKERLQKQEELRRALFSQCPELGDVDRQLRGTILDIITSSLRKGSDPGPALQVIRDKNMDLQLRQAQLLQELGYPPNALEDAPGCKKCGDSGWIGTKMCHCLQALCAEDLV